MCITNTHIHTMAKIISATPAATAAGSTPTPVASAAKADASTKSAPSVKVPKSAAAPTAAAASSSASAEPKQPKQPKQPKESSSVSGGGAAVAPVAAPETLVSAGPSAASADVSMFAASHTKLQTLVAALASLRSELRGIERHVERELRAARKASDKKRRKNVNRQPSGFVKPTLISNELAAFLGKAAGSEMARTEVTREINTYIRDKKLQCETNGRRILPDAKLKKLLKLQDGEELTYFNLQRFMSPHFSTAAKVAAASASGSAAVSAK